jgi:hypothetical protein
MLPVSEGLVFAEEPAIPHDRTGQTLQSRRDGLII